VEKNKFASAKKNKKNVRAEVLRCAGRSPSKEIQMTPKRMVLSGGKITFEILVNGHPIKQYPHHGETFVEGRKGSEYTLRVTNNTCGRVEAVVTVDGLSVMNGKEGSFNIGGYLVPAYGHIDIPGWRLDNSSVAKFLFSEMDQAYASLMGKPSNIGVIGCAIFKEKPKMPVFRDAVLYSLSPMRGGTETFGSKGIGTGFGERTEHRVREVEFERATHMPAEIIAIRYMERQDLVALGINLKPTVGVAKINPFPGEVGCPVPPGWKG
jgi:hypothetical protein